MMRLRVSIQLFMVWSLLCSSVTATALELSGRVLDAQDEPVAEALVVICDGVTGVPLGNETHLPFVRVSPETGRRVHEDWAHARTNADGVFRFDGLPEGTYRLIAQTWSDVRSPEGPLTKNGMVVHLRGVAESVAVPRSEPVEIRPMGDATFIYNRGAANDEWYIFFSLHAPEADPVLGPLVFHGSFTAHGIGYARMPGGEVIVRGLPGRPVSYVLFADDSRPGFGAGVVHARRDRIAIAQTNVVTSWSDARHDPPPPLQELTDRMRAFVEEQPDGFRAVEALLVSGREDAWASRDMRPGAGMMFDMIEILGPLDRAIELPWGETATVGEVMAATAYVGLQDQTRR